MGRRVDRQPDGRFAVWSSIVDAYIACDLDFDGVVAVMMEAKQQRVTAWISEQIEHASATDADELDEIRKQSVGCDPWKTQFRLGWEKGVRDFAIWKDGEQLVGCLQTPLREVLERGPSDG